MPAKKTAKKKPQSKPKDEVAGPPPPAKEPIWREFTDQEETKRHPGRPKAQYDLNVVAACGRFKATQETMAEIFGVSRKTINIEMQNPEGAFCYTYKSAHSNARMTLSEAQWAKAMEGDNTMLIWMGKQHLDQKDKSETTGDNTHSVDSQFYQLIQNFALNIGEKKPQIPRQINADHRHQPAHCGS
jgi:hypothetical protein